MAWLDNSHPERRWRPLDATASQQKHQIALFLSKIPIIGILLQWCYSIYLFILAATKLNALERALMGSDLQKEETALSLLRELYLIKKYLTPILEPIRNKLDIRGKALQQTIMAKSLQTLNNEVVEKIPPSKKSSTYQDMMLLMQPKIDKTPSGQPELNAEPIQDSEEFNLQSGALYYACLFSSKKPPLKSETQDQNQPENKQEEGVTMTITRPQGGAHS